MNPIEETLLMIFLEDFRYLDEYTYDLAKTHGTLANFEWIEFKKEELGRTLPVEFEFFVDDFSINLIKEGKRNFGLITRVVKDSCAKHKIKITIVE